MVVVVRRKTAYVNTLTHTLTKSADTARVHCSFFIATFSTINIHLYIYFNIIRYAQSYFISVIYVRIGSFCSFAHLLICSFVHLKVIVSAALLFRFWFIQLNCRINWYTQRATIACNPSELNRIKQFVFVFARFHRVIAVRIVNRLTNKTDNDECLQ